MTKGEVRDESREFITKDIEKTKSRKDGQQTENEEGIRRFRKKLVTSNSIVVCKFFFFCDRLVTFPICIHHLF